MKNEIFYFRFLFVLLLLTGFTSVKAADPIVVYAYEDAITIFQTKPEVRTGLNGSWMCIGGEAAHSTYLDYNIPIETAGTYDIQFVAATREDRHFFAQVNNQLPVMVKFGVDNYSSDWNTNDGMKTVQVYFDAGDNKLRLSAYQSDGKKNSSSDWSMPLLDRFIISPSEINVSKLADEFSVVIEAQNTTFKTGDWANVDNSFMDGTTEIFFHGITGQTGFAVYDFEIPEGQEGFYNLAISYASWDERHINLIVNENTDNEFAEDIKVWNSGNWGGDDWCWGDQYGLSTYTVMTQVNLPAGTNSIKFAENTSTDFDGKYPNISLLKFVKVGEYVASGTGIVKPNVPDGISVYGLTKKIVVSSTNTATYSIYNLAGKVVDSGIISAKRQEIPANAGVYIVKVNNSVKKVIVK